MKKAIGFVLLIIVFGAIYLLVEKFIVSPDRPKTEKELQGIADRKFSKEIGETFEINGLKCSVDTFFLKEAEHDSATLLVNMSIEATDAADIQLQSEFYGLRDDYGKEFLPKQLGNITIGKGVQKVILVYRVPERMLPYFLYRLYLNPTDKTKDKVIVTIYKNFRSNG